MPLRHSAEVKPQLCWASMPDSALSAQLPGRACTLLSPGSGQATVSPEWVPWALPGMHRDQASVGMGQRLKSHAYPEGAAALAQMAGTRSLHGGCP